jgi:hypothetical protein
VFFQQLDVADDHAAVGGFAHVVNGQQGHLHGREGFHLDTGLAHGFGGGRAHHLAAVGQHFKLDRHAGQRDWVAQRNEVAGLLGPHDACQASNAQHIALLGSARLDQRQCGRLHADAAHGHGGAVGAGLGAHVDHVGLPLGVEVGQGRGDCTHKAGQEQGLQEVDDNGA